MSRQNPRFHRINPQLPPVGGTQGVVEFIVQGVIEQQMTISTFTYLGPVFAPTQLQLGNLLVNIRTNIFNVYRAAVSADWTATFTKLNVVHRNDISGLSQFETAGGTGPAGHEPTEVAVVLLRKSATKGQHGRGRLSLPAVPTSWVTSSNVTAALAFVAFNNLILGMAATASDGVNSWAACIGQRGAVPPRIIVGAAPIVAFQQTTLLGTIRRRKIGRGK